MQETKTLLTLDETGWLASLVEGMPNLKVVAALSDLESLTAYATESPCDVVLIDLDAVEYEAGILAARQIREEQPSTGVVLLANRAELSAMSALPTSHEYGFSTGWSFLLKNDRTQEQIERAILVSSRGLTFIDASVLLNLQPRDPRVEEILPPRLKDILSLADKGYSNKEMQELLVFSPGAVEMFLYRTLQAFFDAARISPPPAS